MAEQVQFEQRSCVSLATVMVRKGFTAQQIGKAIGLSLEEGSGVWHQGPLSFVGTGPGTWLAVSEDDEHGCAGRLQSLLGDLVSVSDQSGGYVVFRLSGADARKVLQRGAPIDLDPQVFGPGSAATTVIAHIGVIIWQDGEDGEQIHVAVFRSFAESFVAWLNSAIAAV